MKSPLEFGRAVAVVAGPGLGAVLVAAFAPVVGVLHAGEIEIFFPVGSFFLKRRRTVTNFNPSCRLVFAQTRLVHIAKIFALGNRTLAQGSAFDGAEQVGFAARLNVGSNEISHTDWMSEIVSQMADCGRDGAANDHTLAS